MRHCIDFPLYSGTFVIVVLCQLSNFSVISWPEQVNFQRDDDDDDYEVRFVLGQHDQMDFYSAGSLKQQSVETCRPTRTHYTDSEPPSLCSFSLMLHA